MGVISPIDKMRRMFAFALTLAIHVVLFAIFNFTPDKRFANPTPPIPVQLVTLDAPKIINQKVTVTNPAIALPIPAPKPSVTPSPVENTKPDEESVDENVSNPSPAAALTPSQPSVDSNDGNLNSKIIPDRWRLPSGASIPLDRTRQPPNPDFEALSKTLDCFGFDVDCALQRKDIFAEEQLTETDLVWMRSYAHSGLSNSEFYGMSEAQIRERLGVPTAGKNGLMIFPGIVLDGAWWDALHGVNKACEYGLGVNDAGQKQLMKRCKSLKPSPRDEIGLKPKPLE